MPFRDVKPTREMQSNARAQDAMRGGIDAPQVADLGGGKFLAAGKAGAVGDTSPNYYDDPIVNALAKLPSLSEATQYAGTNPSFHGVQRAGDYQRVIQREMAATHLPRGMEQLGELQDVQREREKRRSMLTPGAGLT